MDRDDKGSEDKPPKTSPLLPPHFKPLPYSVLIGRGKVCSEAVGNRRLRVLASTFLHQYSIANTKMEKTVIVSRIVKMFREACPTASFIKFSDGRWWDVDDVTARDKVSHVMRNLLSEKYRSSSKAKVARRRMLRERARLSSKASLNSDYIDNDEEDDSISQSTTAYLSFQANPNVAGPTRVGYTELQIPETDLVAARALQTENYYQHSSKPYVSMKNDAKIVEESTGSTVISSFVGASQGIHSPSSRLSFKLGLQESANITNHLLDSSSSRAQLQHSAPPVHTRENPLTQPNVSKVPSQIVNEMIHRSAQKLPARGSEIVNATPQTMNTTQYTATPDHSSHGILPRYKEASINTASSLISQEGQHAVGPRIHPYSLVDEWNSLLASQQADDSSLFEQEEETLRSF